MSDTPRSRRATLDDITSAAERLEAAYASGIPCAPVRDLIGGNDVTAAYAVQRDLTARRIVGGARIVGRKIGLTSEAVQQQLGVDQPDFGVLFDDMEYVDGDTIPVDAVLQPRVEAEIAFVLGSGLEDGALDATQVRGAIDYGVAALEICGSRIDQWDISFGDTVADNASAGAFVIGHQRRRLEEFDPVGVSMRMTIDGEQVSADSGAACLGDPIDAVVWLARMTRELGDPLRAGQIILSGALGPMRSVAAGDTVTADLTGLGAVTATFSKGPNA